ncbi:MAG: single-stranded-DNA-specific exonuclease RecJ [Eubacterium sp.]|nr:single-stranded-DNA-specific exonuclease RecJ [Eubacterium sp.]
MKEKWVVAGKRADFAAIGQAFGIDPVVARIIRNRDLTEMEDIRKFLTGGKEDLHDPHLLKDVEKGADILKRNIDSQKKIRIIGDYDIDGVQATYILLTGLKRCGADVDTAIPDRIRDGYGINEDLIRQAAADGVDTIITCDNGISAFEPIALAKALGMTVVVTDHHEVPVEVQDEAAGETKLHRQMLVAADAIINPKQSDCTYPFEGLCGAAVAYKFIQVLYEKMGIPVEESDVFIENAGFATVGDVMALVDENRILVKIGLKMLNHTTNLGMRALILQNQLTFGEVKAWHIGFKIGPCLNASGRLDTAKRALKLLLAENEIQAGALAAELTSLNEERKDMTALAVAEAMEVIASQGMSNDKVLVVYLPECHESLAGIVAGRLREAYYRPALVVTKGEQDAKGSARSIEGYSMYEELHRCSDLLLKYGGHPMAAGFSLKEDRIDQLRSQLNANCQLAEEDLTPKLLIDVPMPVDYISKELIQQLELLEPFGKDNEKPVFADHDLEICSLGIFGKEHNVVRMRLKSQYGTTMDGVYFGNPENLRVSIAAKYDKVLADKVLGGVRDTGVKLHFSYYPDLNSYQGLESIQLKITGFC